MDIPSSLDGSGPNFDMEILASMTNAELFIRLIKDQVEETATLKNQLSSFNSSAIQLKDCYAAEKKKNDRIESENRHLKSRIAVLEERISTLDSNVLNNNALHEQKVAELNNKLTVFCRHLVTQRNILKANHLSSKDSYQHYTNAKEFLRDSGEVVVEDEIVYSGKKKKAAKISVATMTDKSDELERREAKTFCDKSTMYQPVVATRETMTDQIAAELARKEEKTFCDKSTMHYPVVATRGTCTSAFIKKVDAATNSPEPISVKVKEILRIMIDDMPSPITAIADLPQTKSTYSQTEPGVQSNCSVGTMTKIANVRRKVDYANGLPQSTSDNSSYGVKKEKEDSMPDLLNLDYINPRQSGSPINQKLTQLWQMVGQMIFAIIGKGEVFNSSTNMNLINENLNQIRRVFEMESQPAAQFDDINDFFNQPPSPNQFSEFTTAATSCQNTTSSTSQNVTNEASSSRDELSTSQQVETNTFPVCDKESNVPRIRIQNHLVNNVPLTTESSVQCETTEPAPPIFKRPTIRTKRKLPPADCMTRKRSCPKRITFKAKSVQPDEAKQATSSTVSCDNQSTIVSTLSIDDHDPNLSFVEDILRYYRMPPFIDMIGDPEFVIETTAARLVELGEIASTGSPNPDTSTQFQLSSSKSMDFDLESTCSESEGLESTDMETHDEFESPASPPPSNDIALPYREPIHIPTSPKKLRGSVVKDILANFDGLKRQAVRQRKLKQPTANEEQLLNSTRCRIEKYVVNEWTVNEIENCCNDLSSVRSSILSKCVVQVTMSTECEVLSRDYTPPAPSIPKAHQKLVVLIKRIGRFINGFEDSVLFELEKTMFTLADGNVSIAEGVNLTHLFIGLTACADEQSKSSCTLFVYKCLYYYAIKAIPMIHSVLKAFPTILPQFHEGENVTDHLRNTTNILQATLTIILINTNLYQLETDDSSLKKKELSILLKSYYRFPLMQPKIDSFVDILLDRLTNSNNLENISYSLILLAKRNGAVWADEMVQRKLLPQLNHFLLNICDGTDNDERMGILVSAISSIIKAFPITKDISKYQQIFYKILDLTKRQTTQEEAVMALLRTSRFGMVDVYKRICDWKPPAAVSRQCYSMLSTFLYRQNLSYWQRF